VVAVSFVASAYPVDAAQSAHEALANYRYLLGTWNCAFTVGPTRGTYTTSWTQTLEGSWFMQNIDQPPTQRSMMKNGYGSAEPGFKATVLVGYDPRHDAYVRFTALSTGQYFPIRMTALPNGGWSWTYVSFFHDRKVAKPDAELKRVSEMRYTIDGPTYPDDVTHAMVTEHHACDKSK
jgi:hypothetical protein